MHHQNMTHHQNIKYCSGTFSWPTVLDHSVDKAYCISVKWYSLYVILSHLAFFDLSDEMIYCTIFYDKVSITHNCISYDMYMSPVSSISPLVLFSQRVCSHVTYLITGWTGDKNLYTFIIRILFVIVSAFLRNTSTIVHVVGMFHVDCTNEWKPQQGTKMNLIMASPSCFNIHPILWEYMLIHFFYKLFEWVIL